MKKYELTEYLNGVLINRRKSNNLEYILRNRTKTCDSQGNVYSMYYNNFSSLINGKEFGIDYDGKLIYLD